ncbi:MAG: cyclophilin-like family protein [Candidatus Hodarchaeota archaeon]
MSYNQYSVEFSIVGQNTIGQATFKRDLASQTVALIGFRLKNPIQSRVVVREGEVNIPFKIGRVSPEMSRRDVKRGEVAYWPQSAILMIFLKDKRLDYPVNVVGFVNSETMKFFDTLRIGKSIKLEMIKLPIDEADYL